MYCVKIVYKDTKQNVVSWFNPSCVRDRNVCGELGLPMAVKSVSFTSTSLPYAGQKTQMDAHIICDHGDNKCSLNGNQLHGGNQLGVHTYIQTLNVCGKSRHVCLHVNTALITTISFVLCNCVFYLFPHRFSICSVSKMLQGAFVQFFIFRLDSSSKTHAHAGAFLSSYSTFIFCLFDSYAMLVCLSD